MSLNTHLIWKVHMADDKSLKRGIIKARILTGSYNLHGQRVHYESPEYQSHCKLCSNEIETRDRGAYVNQMHYAGGDRTENVE